jgi:hypothetical protein
LHIAAVLLAWARRELAPWHRHKVPPDYALARYAQLNEDVVGVYVYRFAGGTVAAAEKPDALFVPGFHERSLRYLAFFQYVANRLPPDFEAILCLNLADNLFQDIDAPIFSFQKPWYRRDILLPDIDFLDQSFYTVPGIDEDPVAYDDKRVGAVFAGATTGGTIRAQDVRDLSLPRLRAAAYFQRSKLVDFRLPTIVQYDSEEVRALLAALPFCQTATLPMTDQYRSRFLISMDGNGATCSRVVRALRSQAVLLKYNSDHILYYFHGLQPWLHYIPIAHDSDVEDLIRREAASPGLYRGIAEAGRDFAARYLTRDTVTQYMANLLRHYADCFDPEASIERVTPEFVAPVMQAAESYAIKPLVHVQDVGDMAADGAGWAGRIGSGKAIEGFTLLAAQEWAQAGLRYQALQGTHVPTQDVPAGVYCGTHGRGLPLLGFCITRAQQDVPVELSYQAVFLDGSGAGPLPAGAMCYAASGAPMESMRVLVRPRP